MRSSIRIAARRTRVISAAVALTGLGAVASSASAAVILQSGTSTGGMTLNASNVLVAAGPFGSSTTSGGAYTNATSPGVVQSVSFAAMTASTGTITYGYSNSTTGVGVTLAAFTGSANAQTNMVETAPGGVYPTGGAAYYSTDASTGTVTPQPADSSSIGLTQVVDNGLDIAGIANYLRLTISGLQSGQTYSVDLIESLAGSGGGASNRTTDILYGTQPVYNGSSFTSTPTDSVALNSYSTYSPVYDSNEQFVASGSSEQIYFWGKSFGPVFTGVVVSSTPEPASLGLLSLAGAGLLMRRRRAAGGCRAG